jgi:DNA-binding response OmpR family regulator
MMPSRHPATEPVILIVDDDVDARRMYADYVRSRGWRAYTAADGRSGIDRATELKPDAVVLDLVMPRVDGWTVLKTLRESSWTAPMKIVVVTALQEARDQAIREGADAYLAKPCPPDVVWQQLRALLKPHEQTAAT